MADRTASVSGLWSEAATWGGAAPPVDGQTWEISAGVTVTFDADTSALANGLGVGTILGILACKTTGGPYYLKQKGNIAGSGSFLVGTASVPLPYATLFTIYFNGAYKFDGSGGLTCAMYCTEPTIPYAKLSGAEAVGQTELGLDRNVTTDPQWIVGAKVNIDDIGGDKDSESRIIAAGGVSTDHIDVTVALAAAKNINAWVHLIDRNVSVKGATGYCFDSFAAGKLALAIEVSGNSNGLNACSGASISGGTISGNITGLNACSGASISGGTISGNTYGLNVCPGASISGGTISGNSTGLNVCPGASISGGTISGNSTGLYYCSGASISGGTISGNSNGLNACSGASISGGTISGNTYGLNVCPGASISGGTISGNTTGLYYCSGALSNVTFGTNTYDLRRSDMIRCIDCLLGSTNENYEYNTYEASQKFWDESQDHDQVPNAFKSWTKGDITVSCVDPTGAGEGLWRQMMPASATFQAFTQWEHRLEPGEWLFVSAKVQKDAAMAYLPRLQIVLASQDPLVNSSYTPLAETIIPGDAINTLYHIAASYQNTNQRRLIVIVRFLGKNASGNIYFQVKRSIKPTIVTFGGI